MTQARRGARLVVALGTVVALGLGAPDGRARAAGEPDPRQLYAEGQFAAAAAAFEARWRQAGSVQDGLNAAIAWRAAGRYAHARVLLGDVRGKLPASGPVATRAGLLDAKLVELTGALVLEGSEPGDIVRVDGVPAERLGDEIVVDVGRRALQVVREGCTPASSEHLFTPGERKVVRLDLDCPVRTGNLHVSVSGVPGAEVTIDGQRQPLPRFDLDVALAPGPHHIVVRRRGLTFVDDTVVVAPGETTRRHLSVPWRGRASAVTLAATGVLVASPHGILAAYGGSFGYFQPLSSDHTGGFRHLGIHATFAAATSNAPGLDDGHELLSGVGLYSRLWGPLWQARGARSLYLLELDAVALDFGMVSRGSVFSPEGLHSYGFVHVGSLTFTAELPGVHLEAVLWPLGVTWREEGYDGDEGSSRRFGAHLQLLAGWAFIGY